MSEDRIFTDEELEEMGKRTLDLVLSSIEAGDGEKASALAKRMYGEFRAMHDLYRDWTTHLLSFIGERFGDDTLHDALKETVDGYTKHLGERYAGKDIRQKMQMLAAGLRGHLQPFVVTEEEDRFVITAHKCGSGGNLINDGGYEPPRRFLKVKKAQPMTFDRPNFPVYCAHCYFQNISPLEKGDDVLFITEPAAALGAEPCRIYISKKQGSTSEEK